jgi:Fic family protein
MDPKNFKQAAGKLIQVGKGNLSYWAFVPNPLPPQITWNTSLVQELSKADRALGELAGLGRTIPNPYLFLQPFLRREAVLSSRIEGTQTDIAGLYAYEIVGQIALPGMKNPPPESDVREVLNYVRALEYGLQRLNNLPVSLRLMRELHGHLMNGVRGELATPGEFRTSQNWIGEPGCTLNEASFVPPPIEEMQKSLSDFENYLYQDDQNPLLIKLALIHYQFEAIHPFIDGNGRIGRLLLVLLLMTWDILPMPLLYLSAYFERNRQKYYDLLMAVSQRNSWDEWLIFFLRGIQEQAYDAVDRAKKLQDLQIEWKQILQKEHSSRIVLSIVDFLFEQPIFTPKSIVDHLKISHQAVMKSLSKLEELKFIAELSGRQRNRVYCAIRVMQIVE